MFSRKGPGFTALLRRVTHPPARLCAIAFPPVVPHVEKKRGLFWRSFPVIRGADQTGRLPPRLHGMCCVLCRVTRPPACLCAIAFPPVVPHGEKNAGGVFGAASLSSGGQIKRDVCRRVYAGCAVSSAVYAFAQSADGEQILSAAFPTENAPSRSPRARTSCEIMQSGVE